MNATLLKIDGMSCSFCVAALTKTLENLPGVTRASISLEKGEASVEHVSGSPPVEMMIHAVEEEGYDATALSSAQLPAAPSGRAR